MTLVALDDIETDRVLQGEPADVTALAADIKKNGLQRPIIVLDDMTLVDGLRRIEAVRLNGQTEIDAVITDDLMELHDLLRKVNEEQGVPPPRRIFEYHSLLKELIHDYHSYLRNNGLWQMKDRPADAPTMRVADYILSALNLPYRNYISRIKVLYTAEAAKQDLAVDLVKQVESGEMTIGRANYIWEMHSRNPHNMPPLEQKNILSESLRNLGVITKALRKLPVGDLKIPQAEIEDALAQLKHYRGEIYSIYRSLGREARKGK